jgi:hypothetical protein
VKNAINTFVVGCKSDGVWGSIKSCCILAGARSLLGVLAPLKGASPTNFNFVSSDYNRKTGLKGNGNNKYLNTNRLDTADPLNNTHLAINVTEPSNQSLSCGIGCQVNDSAIFFAPFENFPFRSRNSTGSSQTRTTTSTLGFLGLSRDNNINFISRLLSTNQTIISNSVGFSNNAYHVFRRNASSSFLHSNARMSFYSIGESLDLALLDNRVTTLMNTLNSIL